MKNIAASACPTRARGQKHFKPWAAALLLCAASAATAQAAALRELLTAFDQPAEVSQLAAAFEGKVSPKRRADIQRLLETMAAVGAILAVALRRGDDGRLVAGKMVG